MTRDIREQHGNRTRTGPTSTSTTAYTCTPIPWYLNIVLNYLTNRKINSWRKSCKIISNFREIVTCFGILVINVVWGITRKRLLASLGKSRLLVSQQWSSTKRSPSSKPRLVVSWSDCMLWCIWVPVLIWTVEIWTVRIWTVITNNNPNPNTNPKPNTNPNKNPNPNPNHNHSLTRFWLSRYRRGISLSRFWLSRYCLDTDVSYGECGEKDKRFT